MRRSEAMAPYAGRPLKRKARAAAAARCRPASRPPSTGMSGKRLRLLRQINEVSLEKLAEIVDVAPQQIQKYEIGETRISASRIYELSKIFRVPVAWFYDDLEAATSAEMQARIGRHQADSAPSERAAAEASQEALLVTYYAQLPPDMQREADRFRAHAVRAGCRTGQVRRSTSDADLFGCRDDLQRHDLTLPPRSTAPSV